jgi:hypothetical protein
VASRSRRICRGLAGFSSVTVRILASRRGRIV